MRETPHEPSKLSRRMQWLILLLFAAPLMLALPFPGKPLAMTEARPIPEPPTTMPDSSSRRDIESIRPVVGMAINAHHISDLDLYLQSVDTIADLNANALIVLTPMWMKKVDSSEILYYPRRCPTNDQLIAILTRAKERGLHTTLMPIVLLEKAGKKEWRGVIEPTDWRQWWGDYYSMLDRFIGIANAADVDMLSVGSELNSTEDQRGQWEEMIRYVRGRFDGQITYSSNWDRYDKCELWDLVDVMSVSSYFELDRNDPDAPHDRLVRAWTGARTSLIAQAERWKKPLLISEVGYPTVPWATAHPWNYVAEKGTTVDHAAQARGFRAFFDAWSDVWTDPDSAVLGFQVYHWDPYHRGGEKDFGYGFVGKPSMSIIRENFASITGRPIVVEPPADAASTP
ncbi:MAG: hypothetical protein AAF432_02295 [Planctomycetota bacterium]